MIAFKQIIDFLENSCADTEDQIRSYSGRGMNGKECLGVVCQNPYNFLIDLVIDNLNNSYSNSSDVEYDKQQNIVDILKMLKNPSVDNMGHDKIIYWSHITWED